MTVKTMRGKETMANGHSFLTSTEISSIAYDPHAGPQNVTNE
jgi:hypothetical protein